MIRTSLCSVFAVLLTCVALGLADEPPPADAPKSASDVAADLDDPVELLTPARPRSSTEEDRMQARALFAAARTHEQQEEYAIALRLYERAARLDPSSVTVLRQIVLVGILHYERVTDVLPYALKLVERDPSFTPQLRQLGQSLIEQGDLASALRLLQKSLAAEPLDKKSARYILVQSEIGRLLFLTDDFAGAADAFGEVVEALNKPDDFGLSPDIVQALLDPPSRTWSLFAESFLKVSRVEPAIEAFRKAYQEPKQKGLLGYHLARAYQASGDATRALVELQAYFDADERDGRAGPYELLGEILTKLDRNPEYLPKLAELRQKSPDIMHLALHLADEYRRAGQTDEAVALYNEVLDKSPDQAAAYRGLLSIYFKSSDDEQLLKTLGRYAAHSGDLTSMGGEADDLLEDKTVLLRLLVKARQLRADQPDAFDYGLRLTSALVSLAVEDFASVNEFYQAAIEAKPDNAAELYMGWGIGLLSAERADEAADVFQKAIDRKLLPEENPIFYYFLSGALETAGKTAAAIAAIDHAVKASPESPRLYSRVGWIYYHAKQYSEAGRAYEDLIDQFATKSHTSPEARRYVREARLILSNICIVQKNFSGAEEWLAQVLDENPDDVGAMNDLAYIWADQGKHLERALKMSQQAVEAEPDNAAYRDTLGWAFFRLARFEEALPHLVLGATGEKPDGVVLDHLGDAYWALKQTEPAVAAWRRALERYNPQDDAEHVTATKAKLKKAGIDP